jgi:hypothetical protein
MFPAIASTPLFGAVPGGPELLIIILLILLFFGPVVLLVGFLGLRYVGNDSKKRELERRVEELEAKVERSAGEDHTAERETGDRN